LAPNQLSVWSLRKELRLAPRRHQAAERDEERRQREARQSAAGAGARADNDRYRPLWTSRVAVLTWRWTALKE